MYLAYDDGRGGYYKYKDYFDLIVSINRSKELLISESFADELSKQITRQIVKETGINFSTLKKIKYLLSYNQYSNHYYFDNHFYFTIKIYNWSGDATIYMWISWHIKGYDSDMLRSVHWQDDFSDKEIIFEIQKTLPKQFVEEWETIQEKKRLERHPKSYWEAEERTIEEERKKQIRWFHPDDWEEIYNQQKIEREKAQEKYRFDKSYWITDIQNQVTKKKEEQRKYQENRKYNFEFEIICGYPDVNLVVEFSEEGKVNKERTKKKIDRLFAKYMDDMGEEGIHCYNLIDEKETEKSFNVFIDLGGVDTDFMFFDVLKKLHSAKLGISKVSFV